MVRVWYPNYLRGVLSVLTPVGAIVGVQANTCGIVMRVILRAFPSEQVERVYVRKEEGSRTEVMGGIGGILASATCGGRGEGERRRRRGHAVGG